MRGAPFSSLMRLGRGHRVIGWRRGCGGVRRQQRLPHGNVAQCADDSLMYDRESGGSRAGEMSRLLWVMMMCVGVRRGCFEDAKLAKGDVVRAIRAAYRAKVVASLEDLAQS
ncbi:hypothetical protein L1887_63300 [Cichorium endivia]|nr:hypothetical protein L1887_63300 [Cichorium endivia]